MPQSNPSLSLNRLALLITLAVGFVVASILAGTANAAPTRSGPNLAPTIVVSRAPNLVVLRVRSPKGEAVTSGLVRFPCPAGAVPTLCGSGTVASISGKDGVHNNLRNYVIPVQGFAKAVQSVMPAGAYDGWLSGVFTTTLRLPNKRVLTYEATVGISQAQGVTSLPSVYLSKLTRVGEAKARQLLEPPATTTSTTLDIVNPSAGQTVHVLTGLWTGNPKPTLKTIWQDCASAGVSPDVGVSPNCTTISGATESSYVVQEQDGGFILRGCVVGVNTIRGTTNRVWRCSALSDNNRVVAPPVFTGTPSLSTVNVEVGQPVSVTPGTPTVLGYPAPTLSYRWRLSDQYNQVGEEIPGATGSSYTPQPGEEGSRLQVTVYATNSVDDGGGILSNISNPIAPALPDFGA